MSTEVEVYCIVLLSGFSGEVLGKPSWAGSGTGINVKRHDAELAANSWKQIKLLTDKVAPLLSLNQCAYLHHAEHSDDMKAINEKPYHFMNCYTPLVLPRDNLIHH